MNREYEGFQKCIVLISRAENLLDGNEKKNKKPNKWQVTITGCKKKYQTNFAACHVGNPFWNQTLEIKLIREQMDPIVLNVIDISHNHYGQVVIPLNQIRTSTQINGDTSSRYSNLQCCELEPSRKCSNPLGILFFSITNVAPSPDELVNSKPNITKRHSIFGLKFEPKSSRKLSFMESTPHIAINHYDSKHLPKRLSVSKSNEKPSKFNIVRAKAKSVANIHSIEDIDDHYLSSSDLDSPKQPYLPPDDVYAKVTYNHGWIRVAEMCNDNSKLPYDANSIGETDQAHVDLFSVKPNQGPTTGNFTVIIEGTNFESGLFDLTYVCIDGLEPIDSTTCTKVLSDTELSLTMPSVPVSGMVNIDLELLDGSRLRCSENFLYTNSPVDSPINNSPKTIEFDNNDELFDQLFDHYDDTMPQSDKENKTSGSDVNIVAKSTDFHLLDRRKHSDYGSQGSFRSDRTSSIRKKVKKINMTKDELLEDVEKLRNQVNNLTSQLSGLETSSTLQIDTLKCQLESREKQIDYLSTSLCTLKMQLFNDGLHKYLELI